MKCFAVLTLAIFIAFILGFAKKPKPFDWMDRDFTTAIKGFSILTVVWAHSGAMLGVEGIQFIAGIGVSLFLICSGYGLEMSYQKNGLKGFWKKRFLKVCVPFWIVELIGLLITQQFEIKKFLLDTVFIKQATGYGWFMQYIVICYILFFFVKIICEKIKIDVMWLLIAVFAAWFIIDSFFFADSGMPFLRARQMFSFPFGMLIAKNKDKITSFISIKRRIALIIICGGITGALFMAITQMSAIKALPYIISNVMALFTVLPLAISVLFLANAAKRLIENLTLIGIGAISYEIYLVHAFTLGMVSASIVRVCLFVTVTVVLSILVHLVNCRMEKLIN